MTEDGKTSNARSFVRRWGILGSGFALIAVGGIWAAIAYASTSVQITGPNGTETVDVAQIPENTQNVHATYKVGDDTRYVNGFSLQRVLSRARIEEDEWSTIFINNVSVKNGEVFDNDRVPVFYIRESTDDVVFIRPKRGAQPGVAVTAGSQGLRVNYRLPLSVTLDKKNPKPGDEVTFTAEILNGGPQKNYSFEWDAGSSGSGTERSFTVTLPSTEGRFQVSVEATRSGQIAGTQTFGTPVKSPEDENDGSGSGSGGTGSSGYTPPYTPPSFPDTSTPAIPEAPSLPKDQTKIPEIPEDPTATEITGELMSFTDPETGEPLGGEPAPIDPETGEPAPADDPAAETPAEETIAQQLENESITGPRAAITLGVIISLLGLGAGRELERFHPRRLLRRPNLSGLRRLPLPWK